MPKHTNYKILRRWQAMDKALTTAGEGLDVSFFARQWKVSEKTVYRDLATFRQLGKRFVWWRGEGGTYSWKYDHGEGEECLFVASLSPRVRKAVQQVLIENRY